MRSYVQYVIFFLVQYLIGNWIHSKPKAMLNDLQPTKTFLLNEDAGLSTVICFDSLQNGINCSDRDGQADSSIKEKARRNPVGADAPYSLEEVKPSEFV